ncbi:MAG: mechanosensitive ion channel family protein [Campylobacterota bacterium]|nr:mechanosensitive ion channel family protein [Campylobacterota bacterium]
MKLIFIFIFIFSSVLHAEEKYTPFITQQILLINQLNENNVTQEQIDDILDTQLECYNSALESVMKEKRAFIEDGSVYDSRIFRLKKLIKINKKAGYKYAVLRDEIQLKSYYLLANQNLMMRSILASLNDSSSLAFTESLNDFVAKNQLDNSLHLSGDYAHLLDLDGSSSVVQSIKENLNEFYAIGEINMDVISYLYKFENKIFRLNKYAKYNLLGIVLKVNNFEFIKTINPILENYGLNVIKLVIILFLIGVIYFIRKVAYVAIEGYLLKIDSLKKYSKEILFSIRKPIELIIIVLNINIIIYVYNDFTSVEVIRRTFNIFYGFLITLIFYKVLNIVATIKLQELDTTDKKVKNELINVGIKIANFIIFMIGLLIILYMAGVNLTAVLSGLGIGGFAVALAAKDSLANFFGTLSILLSDVFSQGDWIVIGDKEGVVVEIGLRVTTIRTFDNALIAIPNSQLANQDVKNWNKRELGRRIKMSLGIKYDSKSEDIKNAIGEIRKMLDEHLEIATENTQHQYRSSTRTAKLVSKDDLQGIKKTLLVYLDEFSDSSINILVYCFTKSTDWDDWLGTKEDVMHKIMDIFEKNNLEFAFPSMSIYKENDSNTSS